MTIQDQLAQIKVITGAELVEAPVRGDDRLSAVMTNYRDQAKFATDPNRTHIIGLNLENKGLTDKQWADVLQKVPELGNHLQALKLSGNKLKKFEYGPTEFTKLTHLSLSENRLSEFLLSEGMTEITSLNIEGNPLENPGPEVVSRGPVYTLNFLKSLLTQGVEEVYEIKMLIVGEGETGKTTFWHLLQDRSHPVPLPEQDSTIGVVIKDDWNFTHPDFSDKQVHINLWDFGGQDIQYMTHQFFLTQRSLYVLMASGRSQTANFPYWLKIISLLGCKKTSDKKMPVLVVLNEKGNPNAQFPYDSKTVEKDYPRLDLMRRMIDFKNKTDGRLDAIEMAIKEIVCHKMEHLPLKYPKNWNKARELVLANRERKYWTYKIFKSECEACGIDVTKDIKDLSQWLHDLGIILHFQDDLELKDFVILKPQWATDAVYELMRHSKESESPGRFDEAFLMEIWEKKGLDLEEQKKIKKLMLKDSFEICFEAKELGKNIYIAPQLLPSERPVSFEWRLTSDTLRYIYQYPFMPKGIIGRLTVRLHEDIMTINNKKIVWDKGCLIEKDGAKALVIEDSNPNDGRELIRIEVQGGDPFKRKSLLRDVRVELNKIHTRSFDNLKVSEKVPCNCPICNKSEVPFEFDFLKLEERIQKNILTAECEKSFQSITVKSLLESVLEEYDKLNPMHAASLTVQNVIQMPNNPNPPSAQQPNDPSSIYAYLIAVLVIGLVIFGLLYGLDFWKATLGIVALVILLATVGAFQLRNDDRFSEKSFMELMKMIFSKIPPISWFMAKNKR